jgi:ribosomal protein S18 acetylase RimI-like enzyme
LEADLRTRPVTTAEADVGFLREMLYEAAAWRPGHDRPSIEAVWSNRKLTCYVCGWGRLGDFGLIALDDGEVPIGAAWYRLFTEDVHGFGYISPVIPEVTIGVTPAERARGVGTTLLRALIEQAHEEAFPALSLSVEEDNPAVRLYERLGFTPVGRVENAWTMRLDLETALRD